MHPDYRMVWEVSFSTEDVMKKVEEKIRKNALSGWVITPGTFVTGSRQGNFFAAILMEKK